MGGGTQRVTSSEIGYAGSPPREVLTRGRSIDSVDRPFHPSDWVDVNLEVPSTPRAASVLTNLTVDTNLYPATTPTSSCSNLKDVTPIPPPRRRKRNKGRPLPPKPDEVGTENSSNGLETGNEPLYSSVRSPKSSGDEQEAEEKTRSYEEGGGCEGKRAKEIYEHKVNGTGRVISSDVVSGRRCYESGVARRIGRESDEYERFANSRTSRDSSTPKREEKRKWRQGEKRVGEDRARKEEKWSGNARYKHSSTVSLPNYDELDTIRHRSRETDRQQDESAFESRRPRRPVRSSTVSLPAESFLSPFSEKTSVRLEDYVPTSDNLSPYQVIEKLSRANGMVKEYDEYVKYDSSRGEEHWELSDIGYSEIQDKSWDEEKEDAVDLSIGREDERGSTNGDVSEPAVYLEKPEAFGKTASPLADQPELAQVDPNRSHARFYDPPTTAANCCNIIESSRFKEPFFLDEAKHRSVLDTIGGSSEQGKAESDRFGQSSYPVEAAELATTALIRTISEESLPREMLEEPDDFFDEKLAKDARNNMKKRLDDWETGGTPPPSPEPRIKSLLDPDHSTLFKILNKEEGAEESNVSSMTPSLTELEAALSDMLEKEEPQEARPSNEQVPKILEPVIEELNDRSGARDRQLGTEGERKVAGRKVSFCSWEESIAATEPRRSEAGPPNLDNAFEETGKEAFDVPPKKPNRSNKSSEEDFSGDILVPTPPRRKNKGGLLLGVARKESETAQNGTSDLHNDRLI